MDNNNHKILENLSANQKIESLFIFTFFKSSTIMNDEFWMK